MENKKVTLGRLASSYGVRGWIKVVSLTDPMDNLFEYPIWLIKHHGKWLEFQWQQGKTHGRFLIVKFPGIEDPETAKLYTNDTVAVYRDQFEKLTDNEFYWDDLIGCAVINQHGIAFGRVTSLIETGANDVLVVKDQHRERLVPYTKSAVIHVDLQKKLITVDWDADF